MTCLPPLFPVFLALFLLSAPAVAEQPQAKPVHRDQPPYPQLALDRNYQGWVVIRFSLADDGSVREAEVVDSLPGRVFEREALATLRTWRYETRKQGDPDAMREDLYSRLHFVMNNPGGRKPEGLPRKMDCPGELWTDLGPVEEATCTEYNGALAVSGRIGDYQLRYLLETGIGLKLPLLPMLEQVVALGQGAVGTEPLGLEIGGRWTSLLHYRQGDRICAGVIRLRPSDTMRAPELTRASLRQPFHSLRGSICTKGTDPIPTETVMALLLHQGAVSPAAGVIRRTLRDAWRQRLNPADPGTPP